MKNTLYLITTKSLSRLVLLLSIFSILFAINVNAQVTVNPGAVSYATLGAAFNGINTGVHTGIITVEISANTTEAGPCILNSSGAGAASYTSVKIYPTVSGVTVSGATATGRGLIELNGADNVTIDGSLNGAGSTQDLNITNTAANTVTFTSVIRLATSTVVLNCDNVTIKNCNLKGSGTNRNTTSFLSEVTTWGIISSAGATTVAGGTNAPSALTSATTSSASGQTVANLLINNNNIQSAARGISINGSAGTVASGLLISNNLIGNATQGAADQVTAIGITISGTANGVIRANTVAVEGYIESSTPNRGIDIGLPSTTGLTNATVEKNRITRVINNDGGTYNAFGINITGGTNHIIKNNFVGDCLNSQVAGTGAFSSTFGAFGIRIGAGTGHKIYHNTVHFSGVLPGSISTDLVACLGIVSTSSTGMDIRNNIFSNKASGGNPTLYNTVFVCVWFTSGTAPTSTTWNNNAYFQGSAAGSGIGQVGTTGSATNLYLAANFNPGATSPSTNLRAITNALGAGNDNASYASSAATPVISNSNLHLDLAAGQLANVEQKGAAGIAVADDIDGQLRPNSGTTFPDMGADEVAVAICSAAAGGTISPAAAAACNGKTYTMSSVGAEVGSGISYQWEISSTGGGAGFADVVGGSGATSAAYTTPALTVGTYYYRLRVTCSFGPVTGYSNELTLTVNANPTVTVSPASASYCAPGGAPVTLTGSGASTYAWSPTTGLTPTTGSPVAASPGAPITYTVTGTDGNGCTATATSVISVSPKVNLGSVIATPSSVCSGGTAALSTTAGTTAGYSISPSSYAPTTDPGGASVITGDDAMSSALTIPFGFSYYGITYTQLFACTNGFIQLGSSSGTTTTYSQLIPDATAPNNIIAACFSDLNVISGTGAIRGYSTGSAPNRIYTVHYSSVSFYNSGATYPFGNVDIYVELFEADNSIEIHVNDVTGASTTTALKTLGIENSAGTAAVADPSRNGVSWNVTGGAHEAWRFSPNGGTISFLWSESPANGTLTSTTTNPTSASGITVNEVYTVVASDVTGCSASGTASVSAGAVLSCSPATFSSPSCANNNFTVTANKSGGGAPFNYVWSDGVGGVYPNAQTITANLPAGTYTFTATISDACGGSCTSSVNVVVNPLPGGTASGPATGLTYQPLIYSVTGYPVGSTFQWQFATSVGGPYSNLGVTTDTANLQASTAGTFYIQVVITNPATGCSASAGPIQTIVTVAGDNVCQANPLTVGLNGPYTNVGATMEPGEASPATGSCTGQASWCSGNIPDNSVWFSFVAPASGRISLHFILPNWDSEIALWSAASCGDLLTGGGTLLAANDDSSGSSPYNAYIAPICVTPGQTYYVQVDGYSTTTNQAFNLLLREEAPIVIVSTTPTPIQCFGYTTCVDVSATGGNGSYTGTGPQCGYGAGDYTFTVTDGNGCVGTSSNVHLTEPDKIEGTTTPTSSTCTGANGSITVTPTGGSGTYASYSWNSSPAQTTQTATGLPAGTYIVTITDNNGCTGTASGTITDTGIFPVAPGAITGPAGACKGQSGIVYTVANVAGMTYNWSLPAGASGSSTTNSISVAFSNAYAGGFICVTSSTICGTSAPSCIPVPVITGRPSFPAAPAGPSVGVCGPTTVTYTIPPAVNATSYGWTVVGTGLSIASGQGTTSITVNVATGFVSGQVRVYSASCSGVSGENSIFVYGLLTSTPQQAIFPNVGVCGGSTYNYAITPFGGASSITWSAPAGSSITDGVNTGNPLTTAGTNFSVMITFPAGFLTGNVSVYGSNACGNSPVRTVAVRSTPLQPSGISGPTGNVCNQSGITYTTPSVTGATGYTWTVPAGVTMVSPNGSSSMTVNFGPLFTSAGNICVTADNACGSSIARCLSVNPRPDQPGTISGATSVCKSQSAGAYSTPLVGGVSYTWTASGGATVIGAGNNATVNFNGAVVSSVILTVVANNGCGNSVSRTLSIFVNLGCRTANEAAVAAEMNAYPNPTSGKLTVSFNAVAKEKYTLKVTDLIGKVMISQPSVANEGANLQELDLSTVAKGMYLLSIEREGAETQTMRITVE